MTSNQIAAQANVINEERNALTAESNRLTKEYNEWYSAETTRHNQSMESIQSETNRIQDWYNTQYLSLTAQKQENDVRLSELGLNLQYANEDVKRQLESEKNQLEARNLELTNRQLDIQSMYNQDMVRISDEKNQIQGAYNDAMVQVAQRENDIKELNAKISAMNAANQVIIAQMNNFTQGWGNYLNYKANEDKVAAEVRGQDVNAETQRRGQNLNYDIAGRQIDENKRHNIVSEVENGVQVVGNVLVGRAGLFGYLNPANSLKSAAQAARDAWDNLWRK